MRRVAIATAAAMTASLLGPAAAGAATTTRVSLSAAGTQLTGFSEGLAMSADARFLAFGSGAPDAVAGDSNHAFDVLVRDRVLRRTVRVSVSSAGAQADGISFDPAMSRGGRYVAFASEATNLVTGVANGRRHIYLRDRDTDGDGRFDEAGATSTTLVNRPRSGTQSAGEAEYPAIGNGSQVAFQSSGADLVPGDTNQEPDVFVLDRARDRIVRVNVSTTGTQSDFGAERPSISRTGRYVAFVSHASNLVAGDTNGVSDLFVRDRDTDADGVFDEPGAVRTTRVSVSGTGAQGNGSVSQGSISADGRHVTFVSDSSNVVSGDVPHTNDVFVRNLQTGRTAIANVSTGGARANADDPRETLARLSGNGRYVVFNSLAGNLVAGDGSGLEDVFVRDRDTDADGIFDESGAVRTTRVSVSSTGLQSDSDSWNPSIAENGTHVGFTSSATNLSASADSNGVEDVFLRTLP